jgi:hypothetical protein
MIVKDIRRFRTTLREIDAKNIQERNKEAIRCWR